MGFWFFIWTVVAVIYIVIGSNINVNYLTNKRIIDRGDKSNHRQPRLWKFLVINIPFAPVTIVFWLCVWLKNSVDFLWTGARSWYLR